jgi:hypothetical protein
VVTEQVNKVFNVEILQGDMIYVANDVLAKDVEEVKGLMSIFFDLDLDDDSEVILLEENLVH